MYLLFLDYEEKEGLWELNIYVSFFFYIVNRFDRYFYFQKVEKERNDKAYVLL